MNKKYLLSTVSASFLLLHCSHDSQYSGPDLTFADTQITAISAGYEHNCATTGIGTFCWGSNYYGELGDGTEISQNSPVKLTILTGFTQLSSGRNQTCAVMNDGTAQCWGDNYYGNIGNSNVDSSMDTLCTVQQSCSTQTPVTVEQIGGGGTLANIASMKVGYDLTCAVFKAGTIACWGQGGGGGLGNGFSATESATPVQVSGIASGATQVDVNDGDFVCAVVSGGAQCWGDNFSGQLGNGSATTSFDTPQQVNGMAANSGVTAIAVGQNHTCAIQSGAVWCWGGNGFGQVGNGSFATSFNTPQQVTGITSGATAVAVGDNFSCALVSGGVQCWGENFDLEMGNPNGAFQDQTTPIAVSGLTSGVTAISAGGSHACAIKSGAMFCWGKNQSGELGDGNNVTPTTPVQVVNPQLPSN